jgi:3',5'-cyclic AMP phosphodiesterase CpdA
VLARELALPHASVLGNHDIRHYKDAGGKAPAIAAYGMPGRYYSFTRNGWRFVMLDSFQTGGACLLDKEQVGWLRQQLDTAGEHVCVVSHAPVLSVAVLVDKRSRRNGRLAIPADRLLANAVELRELFKARPRVRLALSGHIHHVDRADYDTVTYLGGGAVSGSWWNGSYCGFPPAYILLDLYADGSVTHDACFWEQLPEGPSDGS